MGIRDDDTKMKYYIGIDNGLSGGITVIDENQNIISSVVMPVIKGKKTEYDIREIVNIFNTFAEPCNVFVALEKSHVRPISGKRACFMTGFGYGVMQGIIESLSFSYEIVSPNEWMKDILKGQDTKDKKGSVLWCKRKYPNEQWTATDRCKKIHDGMTDSCALAVYCYRRNNGIK